jgi:hypothetical protein
MNFFKDLDDNEWKWFDFSSKTNIVVSILLIPFMILTYLIKVSLELYKKLRAYCFKIVMTHPTLSVRIILGQLFLIVGLVIILMIVFNGSLSISFKCYK